MTLRRGIKSTAILFGELDLLMVGLLQGLFLVGLFLLGQQLSLGWPWYAGLLAAFILFALQAWQTRARESQACLDAFKNNHLVGLVVFIALLGGWLFHATT